MTLSHAPHIRIAPISRPQRFMAAICAAIQFPTLWVATEGHERLLQYADRLPCKGRQSRAVRFQLRLLRWLLAEPDIGLPSISSPELPRPSSSTPPTSSSWASLKESGALASFSFQTEEETGTDTGHIAGCAQAADRFHPAYPAAHSHGHRFPPCICSSYPNSRPVSAGNPDMQRVEAQRGRQ